MRKFTIKKFFALLLIPIVLFMAIYCPSPAVYADSLIDDLVYYGLTVSGYMKMIYSDGGGGGHDFGQGVSAGNPYTKNIFVNLKNAVQYAYDNHNINVNTDGSIEWDQTATNNFYNVIVSSGLGGSNAVYLNSNSLFIDPQTFSDNTSATYNMFNDVKTHFSKSLFYSVNVVSSQDYTFRVLLSIDLSNISFASIDGNHLIFYDNNYNQITANGYYGVSFLKNSSVIYHNATAISCASTGVTFDAIDNYNRTNSIFPSGGTLTLSGVTDNQILPYTDTIGYRSRNANISFSCPSGLVVGQTFNDALNGYNYVKQPDYICPNVTNVFPTISADQYNNTNYKDSYNTYVTNVNNNYNNLNDPDFDIKDFQQIASDQNQLLLNAINSGVENITGVIQDTNQKLDTIIGLLMHIRDMLQEFDGGGGSSGGGTLSAEQINQLLTDLAYIKNNILTATTFENSMIDVQNALYDIQMANEDNYDQLVDINNNLVDIYNALIGQGGTTQNNYYYGDNYYINNYHNNSNNMDDFIDDAQNSFDDSVIDAMKGVVPFVFIIMAGSLFEKLATDPEAPHFEIPFKIDSFGIDESIEIDLANYGAIHDVLDLGWCMLLIAALMVVTFKALYLVASTFF